MRRRALLGTVGAGALAALAGCEELADESIRLSADDLDSCLDRELEESFESGEETNQGISVGLDNVSDSDWTAEVLVERDGESVVDESVTAESGSFVGVADEVIATTGDYSLSVGVDGGDSVEATWRICVDSFILVIVVEEEGTIEFSKPGERFENE